MDRDKNRVAVRIRDRGARAQRNENIPVPRHDHPGPIGLEDAAETQRDVESLVFLGNPLAGHAAAIEAAMSRIDHDRALSGSERGQHRETREGGTWNETVKVHGKRRVKSQSSAGRAGGRADKFGTGVRPDWASGESSFPPCTATAPSATCRKRGRVFVSMKVECFRSSPFKPIWE